MILEIIRADKRLMLCWQRPGMSIDLYTHEFKACIVVYEAVGSRIGVSGPSTKLACKAAGLDYEVLTILLNGEYIIKLKKMEKSRWSLYFVVMHFEGLNKGRYSEL